MPNNDDVNAILQQLRARTEQRLNSDSAPAAAAEKPAVSSSAGSDADKLLEQLRAQREQKQPSAPAPAPAPAPAEGSNAACPNWSYCERFSLSLRTA